MEGESTMLRLRCHFVVKGNLNHSVIFESNGTLRLLKRRGAFSLPSTTSAIDISSQPRPKNSQSRILIVLEVGPRRHIPVIECNTTQTDMDPEIKYVTRHLRVKIKWVPTQSSSAKNPREDSIDITKRISVDPIRMLQIIVRFPRNPFPGIRSRLDSYCLRTQMALRMAGNSKFRRGSEELQINLRIAQIQQVSAAVRTGRRLLRSAQDIRPDFGALRIVTDEVRDVLGRGRNDLSHFRKGGGKGDVRGKTEDKPRRLRAMRRR